MTHRKLILDSTRSLTLSMMAGLAAACGGETDSQEPMTMSSLTSSAEATTPAPSAPAVDTGTMSPPQVTPQTVPVPDQNPPSPAVTSTTPAVPDPAPIGGSGGNEPVSDPTQLGGTGGAPVTPENAAGTGPEAGGSGAEGGSPSGGAGADDGVGGSNIGVGGTDGSMGGAAGAPAEPGGGEFTPSTGPARSLGYVGCSMSVNVAEGYQMLDGERLWPPIGAYNGQVVQNWANSGDPVWGAFEDAVGQYGEPDAVWVMLCIFSNMVTLDEARQIVGNVRERVPNATIYITGQPLYDDPNSCSLAGNGGPDLTDRIASEAAADASLNVIYPGSLGPLGASENSDGCHANDAGRRVLGQQFIDWFGQ